MEHAKILLVEDDENLGHLLKEYLQAKGYDAHLYTDGDQGFRAFKEHLYDLCILDIMMPVKDGFSLAREIRAINSDIPIIFLTAKSMKDDVLQGFKIGADDYITKPFNMEELLLRVEAVMRRSAKNEKPVQEKEYQLGKYRFDPRQQLLKSGQTEKKLTTKESDLLLLLCQKQNQVLTRDQALQGVWGDVTYFNARSMDVYITKLRKYLKDEPSIEIVNVHGKGFKMLTS
jgi:DNA-binding response OmpR family regulator